MDETGVPRAAQDVVRVVGEHVDQEGRERARTLLDLDGGDLSLQDAVSIGEQVDSPAAVAAALGERSLIAMARSEWDRAEALTGQAGTVLREGGIEGFVAAYRVEDEVPEAWRETVRTVLRQRMALHADLGAVADAIQGVPRSRPFESMSELGAISVPAVVVASRDEADPGHPLAVGEAWAAAIPGARLLTEEPGRSPLAWQGGQLSRVIAELASANV